MTGSTGTLLLAYGCEGTCVPSAMQEYTGLVGFNSVPASYVGSPATGVGQGENCGAVGLSNSLKSPPRSAGLSTESMGAAAPSCLLTPWYERKKNVLFFQIGPPNVPPKVLRLKGVTAGKK